MQQEPDSHGGLPTTWATEQSRTDSLPYPFIHRECSMRDHCHGGYVMRSRSALRKSAGAGIRDLPPLIRTTLNVTPPTMSSLVKLKLN
jgi:hypothetical protein